jgi:hypothetical protein
VTRKTKERNMKKRKEEEKEEEKTGRPFIRGRGR